MAHPFTPNLRRGHFNATPFALDTLVFHLPVLAAIAFVALAGAKYLLTKQAPPLRAKCPVINGIRFLDFTVGPIPYLLR
jgi:hypothetical protein